MALRDGPGAGGKEAPAPGPVAAGAGALPTATMAQAPMPPPGRGRPRCPPGGAGAPLGSLVVPAGASTGQEAAGAAAPAPNDSAAHRGVHERHGRLGDPGPLALDGFSGPKPLRRISPAVLG
jgi:hypothetical protein